LSQEFRENRSLALYQEARAAIGRGEYQEAVDLLRRSIDEMPHFKTYEALGESLLTLGAPTSAIPYLAAATILNAGVRAPSILAETLLDLGLNDEARSVAELALSRHDKNRRARAVLERLRKTDQVS